MLDIQALIEHINQSATDGVIPKEWSADWAWTMQPVEAEDLPTSIPLVAFYQGREQFTPRDGSPCFQSANPSVIVSIIICHKTELAHRLQQLRPQIMGFKAPDDRNHLPLYLSDDPGLPCTALDIKGDYIWWQDIWMTRYTLQSE